MAEERPKKRITFMGEAEENKMKSTYIGKRDGQIISLGGGVMLSKTALN
jgi:hypothetical protein